MARTGRGWDAKPPAPRRKSARRSASASGDGNAATPDEGLIWEGAPSTPDGAASTRDGGAQRRGRSLPWSARATPRRDTPGADGDKEEQRDPHEVAREICLRQLATRPRTRSELASALKKKGIADEVSSAVLERYAEVGMIDDAAFARAWVTTRHQSKGLAGRALAQELRQRGVEQEVAAEALSELDSETEAQTALELAMRKLRTTRGEPEAIFRKLVGMLARKGYPGGVAVRAVKEALATRDAEVAELIDPDVYEE